MRRLFLLMCCSALALALAPTAPAGPRMYVGAAEDAAKQTDLVVAEATMSLARLAGMNAIRMTAYWVPGQREIGGWQLDALRNAATGADLNGIRIVLSVYQPGSRTTPLTPEHRAEFAAFAASIPRLIPSITDYIIGNEPNLNLFWMPQFNPDGTSASPAAYLQLLAQTYDAMKAVSPKVNVIGGSVSPRGQDKPASKRHTHSPTRFILELGNAYRASKRTKPVMDAFAFHPYGENSSVRPDFRRHVRSTSIGLAEYDRLVALLTVAFDGTAQRGSTLPIVYDEFGVDTQIPAEKADAYKGREPATTKPVSEATQAAYYKLALEMAYCQPNVVGMLIFHVTDEEDLDRWQSGVYYADDTPKASLQAFKRAAEAVRAGRVGRCPAAARTGTGLVKVPVPQARKRVAPAQTGRAPSPKKPTP
jgi:hypothetical protein